MDFMATGQGISTKSKAVEKEIGKDGAAGKAQHLDALTGTDKVQAGIASVMAGDKWKPKAPKESTGVIHSLQGSFKTLARLLTGRRIDKDDPVVKRY